MTGAGAGISRRRRWLDGATRALVATAGIGVLFTIVLMLLYLFWEALPLARPATIAYSHSAPAPAAGPLLPGGVQAGPAAGALGPLREAGLAPASVTASATLPGGRSIVVATEGGMLEQYGRVRAGAGYRWQQLRRFDTGGLAVRGLLAEPSRQVVFVLGDGGRLQAWHTVAERRLLAETLPRAGGWESATVAADGSALAVRSGDTVHVWDIDNPHPEVSLTSLWRAVWYRDYPAPARVWQATPAGPGDEPKLSLAPLALGTLKAALYTMLVAAPLGVAAAIYTAYFMARPLRRVFKPGVELMEAFPTVVLGFIAGLWLAPRIEDALAGVLLAPVTLLLGTVALAGLWSLLPRSLQRRVPPGFRPLLLLPAVAGLLWLTLAGSDRLEAWVFAGDLRGWLEAKLGVAYSQRNALVVGIAMGFAVVPTVFSLTEDAIFSVPRSLSDGSLALGATRWQTLSGVVLPTASPGILSALMIGFGRAIGETMIVLMAAGNTPIMTMDPFTGMRTLSANIAMEVPEAIVGSTHFRVLFLAALLLFAFTFLLNTIAELVRQRLRYRYAAS